MAGIRKLFATVSSPYLRMELPGWGHLLRTLGLLDDSFWAREPTRRLRGKLHGYEMVLDLSNWSERQTYYLGRFYDLPTQLLVRAAVRPGDTFIDVGGNVGMVTLAAARCAGEAGTVHTFEPNPIAFARLAEHVRINGLERVELHHCGLGDMTGEFTLSVVGDHTGGGTLAAVRSAPTGPRTTQYVVRVLRGDDVLPPPVAPTVVKIDVEGFECRVLRGFANLLRTTRPLVVTEVVDSHLHRAGSSKRELFELMRGHGYAAFELSTRRVRLRHQLSLSAADDFAGMRTNNIVWIIPGGKHERRVRAYVSG